MASMRDIKRRRSSIQSTQQITKAMKLVSTVKLQRARAGAERSKSYFQCMYDTMNSILARVGEVEHKYLKPGETGKKAVILVTSNRGLAGGYNNNVAKLITRHETWKPEDLLIYAIGNKGREILHRAGYEIKEELPEIMEAPAYADAMFLTERLLKSFEEGEISEIYLAYTAFKNTVSHIPTLIKLLPVDRPGENDGDGTAERDRKDSLKEEKPVDYSAPMNFEPADEEALDLIIPKYVASLIYGGLVEALASENGARMQAMDNATNNAAELIDDLELLYNRARQGSITQELTEIIAGANAIQ
ncbi:MAG: ATP synthase F1 subunit gamma [Lachnospiraceae bacterium]|nr:ATP synthase F1 subunit gamma [Lachnospiraceae bacterium]MBR4605995.1 ATP synthase F1 subunit gamma [Lachnospiraceae bacterium]MBR6150635.1 ATP synthase F1 subunit gamma [Lachnospiraceae bacterium]